MPGDNQLGDMQDMKIYPHEGHQWNNQRVRVDDEVNKIRQLFRCLSIQYTKNNFYCLARREKV